MGRRLERAVQEDDIWGPSVVLLRTFVWSPGFQNFSAREFIKVLCRKNCVPGTTRADRVAKVAEEDSSFSSGGLVNWY